MTYKELLEELRKLTPKQLELTVTVEDRYETEAFPASFGFADKNNDSGIEEGHPVLYF
jgi:hypothetical protein